MYTVCSKCNLRLTVTPTDLRAAQGYVRCGRCHNVFNALAALAEESPDTTGIHRANTATPLLPMTSAPASEPAKAPEPEPPPAPAPEPESVFEPEPEEEFALDLGPEIEPPAPAPAPEPEPASESEAAPAPEPVPAPADTTLEFNASDTDVTSIFVPAPETHSTGTFESIVLRGSLPEDEIDSVQVMRMPTMELAALAAVAEAAVREAEDGHSDEHSDPISVSSEYLDLDETLPRFDSAALQHSLDDLDLSDAQDADLTPAPVAAAFEPDASESPVAPEVAAAVADALTRVAPATPPATALPSWLMPAACALLALGLATQMVNHWRDNLAAGSLRRPVTALYSALGIPLTPHWDVTAYEVRQLGAQAAEASNNLEVRASIRNLGRRTQPLPLLRVTLEDQFGNRIAARDLTPAEYLGNATAANATLAPDAHVDAAATFVDPGQNAVGFELDACLKLRADRIVCANDPVRPNP